MKTAILVVIAIVGCVCALENRAVRMNLAKTNANINLNNVELTDQEKVMAEAFIACAEQVKTDRSKGISDCGKIVEPLNEEQQKSFFEKMEAVEEQTSGDE